MKMSTAQCNLEADRMHVIARDLKAIAERIPNSEDKALLLTAANELTRSSAFVQRLGQVVMAVAATRPVGPKLFGHKPQLWEIAGYCCEKAYDNACAHAG